MISTAMEGGEPRPLRSRLPGSSWAVWPSSYLDPQGLDVVRAIGAACEIGQVELNLVPAVIEPHGHGADEGLHPGCALVVTCPEAPAHILIIQHLMQRKKTALLTSVSP